MPLSMRTVASPPTASRTSTSASSEATAPSTCRPPWFETTIPSTPCSSAIRASSAVSTPLTRIGNSVRSRSQARSAHVSPRLEKIESARTEAVRTSSSGGASREARKPGSLKNCASPSPWRNGQIAEPEVARPPAEHQGVEGDDDRAVARRAGPVDDAADELAVVEPVELVPARGVAELRGDVLERARRGAREDHRHPGRRGLRGRRRARRPRGRSRGRRSARAGTEPASAARVPPPRDPARAFPVSIRGRSRRLSKASRFARIVASEPAPPAM